MTQNNPLQQLKNLYHKLQAMQANFKYKFPGRKLKLIGVSGTDGKTTTTSMIYHILKTNGFKVGYISTIEARIGDEVLDTGLHVTTPDPWDVPKYLRMMLDKDVEYVVIEATSSGLQQNRLWGLKFDSATITNIKNDHLDYHGNWENYALAKFRLLEQLRSERLAVLNNDDTKAAYWIKQRLATTGIVKSKQLSLNWYSKNEVSALAATVEGISYRYQGTVFKLPVIGSYNIENSLAAINITSRYLALSKIAKALQTFPVPKGRMEVIQKQPFTVIIDFAHTGHALEEALQAVLQLKRKEARLITVFGCAGKRDKGRRSMGEVSARLADITILTAEDPRNEKLRDVNSEIFSYAKPLGAEFITRVRNHRDYQKLNLIKLNSQVEELLNKGVKPFISFDEDTIMSREDAISAAAKLAKPGDIVFITGKAHEQSLCFGETEYPWSDHDAVKRALN